jgi:hypothetical protein
LSKEGAGDLAADLQIPSKRAFHFRILMSILFHTLFLKKSIEEEETSV